MPVRYDGRSKKWCVGSRCVYDTKEDAEKSYRGYLGKKYGEKTIKKSKNEKHSWNIYDKEDIFDEKVEVKKEFKEYIKRKIK